MWHLSALLVTITDWHVRRGGGGLKENIDFALFCFNRPAAASGPFGQNPAFGGHPHPRQPAKRPDPLGIPTACVHVRLVGGFK